MSESKPAQTAENTPEKVALDLLQMIAHIEKKALHSGASEGWMSADREWLLDTYAECIRTIREPQNRMASSVQQP